MGLYALRQYTAMKNKFYILTGGLLALTDQLMDRHEADSEVKLIKH